MEDHVRVYLGLKTQKRIFRDYRIANGGTYAAAAESIGMEHYQHYIDFENGKLKTVPEKTFQQVVSGLAEAKRKFENADAASFNDEGFKKNALDVYAAIVGGRMQAYERLAVFRHERRVGGFYGIRIDDKRAGEIISTIKSFELGDALDLKNPESLVSKRLTGKEIRAANISKINKAIAARPDKDEYNKALMKKTRAGGARLHGSKRKFHKAVSRAGLSALEKSYGPEYMRFLGLLGRSGTPLSYIREMISGGMLSILEFAEHGKIYGTGLVETALGKRPGWTIERVKKMEERGYVKRISKRKFRIAQRGTLVIEAYRYLKTQGKI